MKHTTKRNWKKWAAYLLSAVLIAGCIHIGAFNAYAENSNGGISVEPVAEESGRDESYETETGLFSDSELSEADLTTMMEEEGEVLEQPEGEPSSPEAAVTPFEMPELDDTADSFDLSETELATEDEASQDDTSLESAEQLGETSQDISTEDMAEKSSQAESITEMGSSEESLNEISGSDENSSFEANVEETGDENSFEDVPDADFVTEPAYNAGEQETFTVTFDANGGYFSVWDSDQGESVNVETLDVTVESGKTVSLGKDVNFEGKSFSGWSLSPDGEKIKESSYYQPSNDCTLYALWKDIYTVTLDANGGYFEMVDYENQIENPESYSFHIVQDEAIRFNERTPKTNDQNMAFAGWSMEKNGDPSYGKSLYSYVPEQSCIFYAVWKPVYTVTIDLNGGYAEGVDDFENDIHLSNVSSWSVSVMEGKDISFSGIYEIRHNDFRKKFLGWSTEKEGEILQLNNQKYPVTESCTLYAIWQDIPAVTFDANGGHFNNQWDDEKQKSVKDTTVLKRLPESEGTVSFPRVLNENNREKFMGWSTSPDGSTIDQETFTVSNDCTLYAIWKKYTMVKIDARGGFFPEVWDDELQKIVEGESLYTAYMDLDNNNYVTPSSPSHTDPSQVLTGWGLSPNGPNIATSYPREVKISEDCTIYALWTTRYTITLDANGGHFSGHFRDSVTDTYLDEPTVITRYALQGETIELPSSDYIIDDSGKLFMGWSIKKDSTAEIPWDAEDYKKNKTNPTYKPTGNVTLYAVWTDDYYTVKLVGNGGSFSQKRSSGYDSSGYATGNSWYGTSGHGTATSTTIMSTGSTMTKKIAKGRTLWLDGPKELGGVVATNEDRKFLGWGYSRYATPLSLSKNSDGFTSFVPTKDTTLYAIWEQNVEEILLDRTSGTMNVGKTMLIKPFVFPSNAQNKSVTWKSSNTKVAVVDSTGKVTAKGKGSVTITATAKDGSGIKASCKLTVKQPVTKIAISKTSAAITTGKTIALTATVSPTTANNKAVTWKSSNTNIATVTQKGVVKGIKKGTATITVMAKDGSGKKATCKITVKQLVTGLTINKKTASIKVKKTVALTVTARPTNANNKAVTWKSSNSKIATVTQKGVVKGIKKGTVTITATTKDGSSKKVTCKVTVK